MLKFKPKSQPLRLLSYGQSTSAPVAIATTVGAFSGILSLLLQFINFGATSANNRYMKAMTFVQLENGSTKTIKSVAPGERTDKVINDFVTNSLIKLFNWDGVINEDDNGNLVQKVDKGIEIETVNGARRKIPTDVWEGAFTLSENQDFRASFLKKLAETIPEGILSGKGTVTLVTNFVSKPRKIEHGKWEVDVIGNLVTFNGERNLSKGITFNKTITVAAIDSPQNPPETSEIAKKIYKAKMSGLEITQIVDYELGKKRK
ncbi:hypothetical protein H6G81_05905 [Scytonema hofmannii FACHB-248]|uniref:Uncharacterized protein n=2 Tax=Scytonema hofmannii TaxID=34078 RepID=A0ABR8GLY0_9CYAN|nr:hypothetical protein [[Scytonema hofmanni] UTEX B 1581]MBD2604070.1 hypothetical protein [Scytonema hofmannii FACHB-248]